MGSCCSKPEPRGVEGTREGRLRTLLRRLCPRGNPPLAETVESESLLLINEQHTTSVNLYDEEDGAATSQLKKSLEDKESQIELADSRTQAEGDLDLLTQQRNEAEASLHTQISELQTQICELTESRSLAVDELEALKVQRSETEASLHTQISQLTTQISDILASKEKLELRDLVNELHEVTDWFHFGLHLGVPPAQLRIIERNTVHDNVRGRSFMLEDWLNQEGSKASWADTVAALVKIKMVGLARRLSDKYGVPMPAADETAQAAQQRSGSSHSEESPSTKEQLLAVIHTLCEKLERHDKKLDDIKVSLEAAKKDRKTAKEKTLSIKGAMEDGQMSVKSLTEQELVVKEQLRSKERELHFLQQFQRQAKENEELNSIIVNKEKEIRQLREDLQETEGKLKGASEDIKILTSQLQQARRELEASCSRVQELEREIADLQAEVNRERMEVDRRLMEAAATIPTQEPTQEIEYQHDQAMELLSESSEVEATCRQEDSQSEEQIGELLEMVRDLENLNVTWMKCPKAPNGLRRGSAVIDIDRHIVYFSDYDRVYAYQWQRKEWSKLPDCPQRFHTLVVVNGLLTAVGGVQSLSHTNTLLSLVGEGSTWKWEEHFPPMPTKRGFTAVVYSGKHLVVIGGEGGTTCVEVMNTETREWFTASSLPFPLTEATVTIVGDNIYLVGGFDMSGKTRSVHTCSLTALLQSCQPHQPQPQTPSQWHLVADTPVYMSTCVTLDGELVAVGGCDSDQNPTDGVYAYDPAKETWIVISHMNTARWQCLAAVLPEDRLMVVGGFSTYSLGSECAVVEIATLAVA